MNLTGQGIYQKPEKVEDPHRLSRFPKSRKPLPRGKPLKAKPKPPTPYLDKVRARPCCICEAFGEVQLSPTEAHHPICDRYSSERVPDHEAVPLCGCHHRTGANGKLAIHRGKETWRAKYGSDRDYIAATQDAIEAMG
jgi:hypothetical protein